MVQNHPNSVPDSSNAMDRKGAEEGRWPRELGDAQLRGCDPPGQGLGVRAGPCRRSTAGGEGGLSGGGLGRKFVCRGGPGRLACSPEVTVKNIWFNLMQETL